MSTQDTKLADALQVLQPTAEVILRTRPMDFDDETYSGFPAMLDDPMRQVLNAYDGSNTFVVQMKHRQTWTPRQSRAVANILRRALRGEDQKFGLPQGAPRPNLPAPAQPEAVKPVLPDFVPVHNINLRDFPPGRFALTDGTGKVRFFIITALKRRSRLYGRFVWTKYRYGNEVLEIGDLTVREQIGDTKKLIGKQRSTDPVYLGEEEDLIKVIADDPARALQEYGRQLNKCGYCGRSLTDEESRLRGIGPDCWESKHVPYTLQKAGIV